MFKDAADLGDPGTASSTKDKFDPDWIPAFKQEIDGVIMVAGHSYRGVEEHLAEILAILFGTIKEVINIFGHVRPGKEDGHEQ